MRCPRNCGNEARHHTLYGILPCQQCIDNDHIERKITQAPEFATVTQQTRIQRQRDDHEKDIIPPFTHDGKPSEQFARAFPDKAKQSQEDYTMVTGEEVKL